jgi:hypothetical protein
MKWTDDLTGTQLPRRRLTLQLALYAMHLGNGGTLLCCTIKAGTIAKYLQAVVNFLQRLHPEQIDPRRVHDADKQLAPPIKAVLTELECWETVPNRREPYTLQMQATLQTWTVGVDNDSYYSACVDWFLLGLYLGLRRSEWAQSRTNYRLGSHQMNRLPTPQPQAFLLGDFEFRDVSGCRVPHSELLTIDPSRLCKLFVTFRTQKNGQNGEQRLVTAQWDKEQSKLNAVAAGLSIVRRHYWLLGNQLNYDTPLAIHRTGGSVPLYITDDGIEQTMRSLAQHTYQLDPVKDAAAIQRWSSHSLRVGGCVILHSMGLTTTQIQHLFRWQSNAFLTYLRNTTVLSDSQASTILAAASNPDAF